MLIFFCLLFKKNFGAHIYDTLSTFQVDSFDMTEIQTPLHPATAKSIIAMSDRDISVHHGFRDSEIENGRD